MRADDHSEEVQLGIRLLEDGSVNRLQLEYAHRRRQVSGGSLASLLVKLGLVTEKAVARHLADIRCLPLADAALQAAPDKEALSLFRREFCQTHAILPLALEEQTLKIAIGDTDPDAAAEAVRGKTGLTVALVQGEFTAVARAIDQAYLRGAENLFELVEREIRRLQQDGGAALNTEGLLRNLIRLAVSERATDIHLTPDATVFLVSFRIDGVLNPVVALSRDLLRLAAAIKVSAGMDIGDSLRPQDGRFSTSVDGRAFDIRVSTNVTPYGESVVMRLLSKGTFVSGLEDLAFYAEHVPVLDGLFRQPSGIVLMTGPTGSGKTTTLYAGLKPHGMSGRSIITVEDPIEYELPSATQTQVNRKASYTFDTAIRHFLRHDPDIMLVGEIRDAETADAAMRASETGHLVLSTLHVNSALSVPGRLASLGVHHQLISEALIGVVNQRLIRQLCPHCKEEDRRPPESLPEALRALAGDRPRYRSVGCSHCRMTGYIGRIPVYEILKVDRQVSLWIAQGASRHEAMRFLKTANHVPMTEVCARRIADGLTSVEEVIRAYGDFHEDWGADAVAR